MLWNVCGSLPRIVELWGKGGGNAELGELVAAVAWRRAGRLKRDSENAEDAELRGGE